MRFYITDGILCTKPPRDAARCLGSFDVPDDARHIDLPEGVLSTGEVEFRLFPQLRTISLPNSLKAINARAFEQCTHLTHINLPDGLRSIGSFAFANCIRLTALRIPENTFLGEMCFAGCVNLRELFISRRQLRYKNAFRFCPFLTVPAFNAVPAVLRRSCVMGFAGHEHLYSEVLQKKYMTHLRKNASTFCKAAFDHPPLLRLLCREVLIKPQYIDQYIFHALKCGNVELASIMLEYAASHRKDSDTLCLDEIE